MDRMQVAENGCPLRGLRFGTRPTGFRYPPITGLVRNRTARLKMGWTGRAPALKGRFWPHSGDVAILANVPFAPIAAVPNVRSRKAPATWANPKRCSRTERSLALNFANA